MVDVLHFLFEDDSVHGSEEHMKSQSSVRASIYRTLYNTTYKYEYKDPKSKGRQYSYSFDSEDGLDTPIKPFDPKELNGPTKSFVAPTSFDPAATNPFGGVLDAPVN